MHVDDIASGVLASVGKPAGTYNLGTGRGTSLNQLAALLTSRINPALAAEYAPAQAGELRYSIADISAARQALGYEPTRSIESAIQGVIDEIARRA